MSRETTLACHPPEAILAVDSPSTWSRLLPRRGVPSVAAIAAERYISLAPDKNTPWERWLGHKNTSKCNRGPRTFARISGRGLGARKHAGGERGNPPEWDGAEFTSGGQAAGKPRRSGKTEISMGSPGSAPLRSGHLLDFKLLISVTSKCSQYLLYFLKPRRLPLFFDLSSSNSETRQIERSPFLPWWLDASRFQYV